MRSLSAFLALALLFLLVAQAGADGVSAPCLTPNIPNVGTLTSLMGVSFLALLLSINVVAIGYIIGRIFPTTGVRNWIGEEFLEIAKNAMLIVGIFAILLFMSNVAVAIASAVAPPGSLGTASGGAFSDNINNLEIGACHYLTFVADDPNSGLPPALNYMFALAQTVGSLQGLTVGVYIPIPLSPTFSPWLESGYVYNPYNNQIVETEVTTGQYESVLNDMFYLLVFPVSLLIIVQQALIANLVMFGLGVMIPLGILFRAFPIVRGIGGTLVAVGIGISIIYPSLLVIVNYPVTAAFAFDPYNPPQVGCGSDHGVCFAAFFTPTPNLAAQQGVSDGIQAYEPDYSLFAPLNGMLFYAFKWNVQFLLFIVDIAIGYPLADSIARTLGGTITLQLGGKLRLA